MPVVQIADRANVRIVDYTLDGEYIGTIIEPDCLRFPCTTVRTHPNPHRGSATWPPPG